MRATPFVVLALLVGSPAHATQAPDPLPVELRTWIDAHGPLRVGYGANTAPVGIVEDGEVVGGWGFELHELMAIKLGIDVEHVVHPTLDGLVAALRHGDVDLVGAMGARPDLAAFAEPTEPLSWTPLVFVGNDQQQGADLSRFAGRTVTTIPGSPIEERLQTQFDDATYVPTSSIPDGLQAVADGEVDLYLGPLAIIGHNLRQLGLVLGPVGSPVDIVEVSAWGRPGSEAMAIANLGRELLTDAEMSVVHVRWTGFDLGNPAARTPRWLAPALWSTLAVALVLGAFTLLLRRRVHQATMELRDVNAGLEQTVAKRTLELRAANADLGRANEGLTRFARVVAHDLRGPLAAVHGLADALQRLDLPEERRNQVLSTIESSSLNLTRMVDVLLEEAVSDGAERWAVEDDSFGDWLTAVLGPEAEVLGAELAIDVPTRVAIDGSVLRRTAVNLAGNALKHAVTPEGVRVQVGLTHEGDTWTLTVDDNGAGVPIDQQAAIFEPGHRTATDEVGGVGIGLAETREMVEEAGGTVTVTNSPSGGARFVATLPAAPPAA